MVSAFHALNLKVQGLRPARSRGSMVKMFKGSGFHSLAYSFNGSGCQGLRGSRFQGFRV